MRFCLHSDLQEYQTIEIEKQQAAAPDELTQIIPKLCNISAIATGDTKKMFVSIQVKVLLLIFIEGIRIFWLIK